MIKSFIAIILFSSYLVFAQTKNDLMNFVNEGKYDDAATIAESVADANKSDFLIQITAANVFYEQEQWEKSLKYFKAAEKIDDDSPEVLVGLGKASHRVGNKEDAFEYFEDARDEDDEYMPVYLEYAEAYIRDGEIGEAQKWVDRGKDVDDEDPRLYLTSGNMYFQGKIYELAKSDYLEALKLDSTNTEVRFRLATSYYWLANRELDQDLSNELFKRALIEWQRVIKEDPFNTKALFQSGKILFWAGRDADAAPILNRFVQLKSEDELGRWYLAQSLSNLGKCDSAAQHLNWVTNNIDSVRVKAKMLLAECYVMNKDFVKAVDAYKGLKQDTTLGLKELKMLGSAAISIGDTVQAIEAWNKSIELNPEANCGVMMALGKLYFVKKDYTTAEQYFQKKLNTERCNDDQNATALRFSALGYVYSANVEGIEDAKKQELLAKAESLISKALTDYGDNPSLKLTLADIYSGRGNDEKAKAAFQEIIEKSDKEKDASILKAAYAKLAGVIYGEKSWRALTKHTAKWNEFQPESETAALYAAISYQNLYISSEADADLQNACKWYKILGKINPANKYAKNFLDQGYCD
ncbi:tetratricopeptide repeat protein [Candidatus Kapabacteria bacterium]|nr:tetratricopeptide repeat protein [Candidatus Kapabacteria bacterium]